MHHLQCNCYHAVFRKRIWFWRGVMKYEQLARFCVRALWYSWKTGGRNLHFRREEFFMHCFCCQTDCKVAGVQRREGGVPWSSQLSRVLFYCQLLTVGFIIVCLENLIPCPTGGSTLPQIPPSPSGATSIRERGEGVWGLLAAGASCPFLILEGVCKKNTAWSGKLSKPFS